jgi:glycosyltransferase involved in cell wall biosynthesis
VKRRQVWLESTHTLSGGANGRTGVGHFTEECISHLTALDHTCDYTIVGNVFATAKPHLPKLLDPEQVKVRVSRKFPGKVWNQMFKRGVMPPLNVIIPGRPDLVMFFNFVRYPLTQGVKSAVVIHDLTFEHFPEAVEAKNLAYLRKFVPRAVREATQVIAVSVATKRDVMDRYGLPEEKVSVVWPGVDLDRYRPGLETRDVRERLGLPEHFFLFLSTIEPRKNILTLIHAYRELPEATRRTYGLVLSGKVGWKAEAILAEIRKGDPIGTIVHTGYVSDADIPALYAAAGVFVLPSLYEGFGMPVAEAMACGVPVITADNSSLPEIVKGAGIMVPALDWKGLAREMERLAGDAKLRAELGAKGRVRAEQISWDSSARQLKAVIDRLLSDLS